MISISKNIHGSESRSLYNINYINIGKEQMISISKNIHGSESRSNN